MLTIFIEYGRDLEFGYCSNSCIHEAFTGLWIPSLSSLLERKLSSPSIMKVRNSSTMASQINSQRKVKGEHKKTIGELRKIKNIIRSPNEKVEHMGILFLRSRILFVEA